MEVMLKWIKTIWEPFTMTQEGHTYLILDCCSCHMTKEVMKEFTWLHTFVDFVPAGYTSVAQPIDVGVNSAFKLEYCRLYNAWFSNAVKEAEALKKKVSVPPRHVVAGWALQAWQVIDSSSIQKTWLHITKTADKALEAKAKEDWAIAALVLAGMAAVLLTDPLGLEGSPAALSVITKPAANSICNDETTNTSKESATPLAAAAPCNDVPNEFIELVDVLSKPMDEAELDLFGGLLV